MQSSSLLLTTGVCVLALGVLRCSSGSSDGSAGALDGGATGTDGASNTDGGPQDGLDAGGKDSGGSITLARDPAFGTGGLVTTPLMGTFSGTALFVQADGKIVIASAKPKPTSGYDPTVQRWTTTGTLDATFGTGGEVITSLGAGNFDLYETMGRLSSGRIILCADSGGLRALTADGQPDNGISFSAVNLGSANNIQHIIEGPGGSILLAGRTIPSGGFPARTFLVKLLPSGAPDTTFAPQGKLELPQHQIGTNSNYDEIPKWLRRLPDESLLVMQDRYHELMVSHVFPDAGVDPAFSGASSVVGAGTDVHGFLALPGSSGSVLTYARGDDGLTAFTFGPGTAPVRTSKSSATAYPIAAGELPDGRVLVAVLDRQTATQLSMQRYHADGTLETDFADTLLTLPAAYKGPAGLALGADGSVVVSVTVEAFGTSTFERTMLARFVPKTP
jgi:uncharacterized delta-60 repeat protein